MRATIEAQLSKTLDSKLVAELLDAHEEVKRNFYLGGFRLSAVEGGRFCEAAFRLLEEITTGSFTPLGKTLDSDRLIDRLRGLPTASYPDSVRLHIPRGLRLVYDVRNKRDAAHLADGIDPNLQDATLVVAVVDWVLAEFIRRYHSVKPDEAHRLVDDIVARVAPIIQDFGGALRVLNPSLSASDHCLILLYHRGTSGATPDELEKWARPRMRANLRRTLRRLDEEKDAIHLDGTRYKITRLGEMDVEKRRLPG